MNKEFIEAVESLEKEKGISKEVLIDAIETSLKSAYKTHYGNKNNEQNVRVNIDRETGDINVFMRMDIVEDVEDEFTEISIEEAKQIDHRYEVGDVVEYQVTPRDFGRIAAQTAKQVVVQRIREAERDMVYDEYIGRQGEMLNGVVQRINNRTIFVNIGKTEGLLPVKEQVEGEFYKVNDRIKVYIMDVKKTTKGPQIFLSRSHPAIVKKLFELEVPEIQDGTVEIKGIAREAGSRTKMAVFSNDENVDPVGACVGNRGIRVQAVVDELFGEKIDIINWSEDPSVLIKNVLSPAKVEQVIINEAEKAALAVVPDFQLSLAIGREGQNVRLAAKVCGWKIDIKSHTQFEDIDVEEFLAAKPEEIDEEAVIEDDMEDVVIVDDPEVESSETEEAITETEEAAEEIAETEETVETEPEEEQAAEDDIQIVEEDEETEENH